MSNQNTFWVFVLSKANCGPVQCAGFNGADSILVPRFESIRPSRVSCRSSGIVVPVRIQHHTTTDNHHQLFHRNAEFRAAFRETDNDETGITKKGWCGIDERSQNEVLSSRATTLDGTPGIHRHDSLRPLFRGGGIPTIATTTFPWTL